MQFKEGTDVCYLRARWSSQAQKCIHSIVLPGIKEGLIILRKNKTPRDREMFNAEDAAEDELN